MKLHEYQSKRIFAQHGVPIPQGDVATTPEEARRIAARLDKRVVVKSQVLVGGRGKAGGIRLADNPNEAEEVADQILGMSIKGLTVKKVLVDEAADIAKEIYLGIVIDRAKRCPVIMASAEYGSHSFIVRFWLEETAEEAGRASWRGYVTHALSGERYCLRELEDVIFFILPYLEGLGVKPSPSLRRWLCESNREPHERHATARSTER